MKHSVHLSLALLTLFGACACSQTADTARVGGTLVPALPAAGTAIVFGTVFDLKTGEPAADVEVLLLGGKSAHTDAEGRFQVSGMKLGSAGEVIARAADGREARLALAALGNERREIVLHLPAK